MTEYENNRLDKEEAIAIIRLNGQKVFNALSHALIGELVSAFEDLDKDSSVKAIVLTGNERAFAAGADIKEMLQKHRCQLCLKISLPPGIKSAW